MHCFSDSIWILGLDFYASYPSEYFPHIRNALRTKLTYWKTAVPFLFILIGLILSWYDRFLKLQCLLPPSKYKSCYIKKPKYTITTWNHLYYSIYKGNLTTVLTFKHSNGNINFHQYVARNRLKPTSYLISYQSHSSPLFLRLVEIQNTKPLWFSQIWERFLLECDRSYQLHQNEKLGLNQEIQI